MGNCKYCGKAAGFMRSQHQACADADREKTVREEMERERAMAERAAARRAEEAARREAAESSRTAALELCRAGLHGAMPLEEMRGHLAALGVPDLRKMQVKLVEDAIEGALEDGVLSEAEEKAIADFAAGCGLEQEELNVRGAWTRIVKAAVLRDVMNRLEKTRVNIQNSPFNLQKSERIYWLFQPVQYFEERTAREYVGGSSGVSIRIAKGLYWRSSAFRGRPVETTSLALIDAGLLALTNKHVYFSGSRTSFRVPYRKIVAFEPFTDGIGIMRDAQTAKPQRFMTGDGWFTYNLAMNLAQLE